MSLSSQTDIRRVIWEAAPWRTGANVWRTPRCSSDPPARSSSRSELPDNSAASPRSRPSRRFEETDAALMLPRASGCWFATAAVVRARYSFSGEQSCERSATASRRSSRPPLLLQPWQRYSEAGAAARAEAVVRPQGRARAGCARSRQDTEFAGSRFRSSTVKFVRRHGPSQRSPRSR
jgi:hypothetical protein